MQESDALAPHILTACRQPEPYTTVFGLSTPRSKCSPTRIGRVVPPSIAQHAQHTRAHHVQHMQG